MIKQKSTGKLLLYGLIVVLSLFGLTQLIAQGHGLYLKLELTGLIFLLVLSLVGFCGYSKPWGERVLFFIFWLYVTNLMLIWYFKDALYLILLLLALTGFLMSMPKKNKCCCCPCSKAPEAVEKKEAPVVEAKTTEAKPAVKHTPGKYIASKRSNVYHAPKCDWAKKIKKERQLWFNSKEEALEKGYKKHDCVQ